MNEPESAPKPTDDEQHLRLLSIFHYVVAGVSALVALFPVIHLAIGVALLSGALTDADEPGAEFVGIVFVVFSSAWIVAGLAFAVLLAFAGSNLAKRRRYTFCLVMAGVACIFMPFGTVLGVFTIIVLMRDSVKESFEAQAVTEALSD